MHVMTMMAMMGLWYMLVQSNDLTAVYMYPMFAVSAKRLCAIHVQFLVPRRVGRPGWWLAST